MPPECTVEEVRRILMQKWRLEALCVGSKERKLGQGCHRTVFYTFPFYKAIVVEADFQRKPFECPISLEIMVDPVLCSDGFVYERVSIESHIQTRQDMEAQRLDGDEQDEEEDETHCGSPRGVIHVTSPCTNEELTSLDLSLVTDFQAIIVALVTAPENPLKLTKEEINDWKKRYEEAGGSQTKARWKIDVETLKKVRNDIEEECKQHRREEVNKTMDVMSQAREARVFGGKGDLRMCGQCHTGPIENMGCSDLHHINFWNANDTKRGKYLPNECPNCGWFASDWNQWPKFDGVYGPH